MAVYLMTYQCTSPAICPIPKGGKALKNRVFFSLFLAPPFSLCLPPSLFLPEVDIINSFVKHVIYIWTY